MSEYQYYELLALDRPLTTDELLPPQVCLLHGPSWPNWRSSDPRSALASVSDRPRAKARFGDLPGVTAIDP